jgi:hypothetical protein
MFKVIAVGSLMVAALGVAGLAFMTNSILLSVVACGMIILANVEMLIGR